METKIKICGLSRLQDIETANRLKPDYIGLMFYRPSCRYITKETARKLSEALDPAITPVAVFLDEDFDVAADIATSGIAKMIQLHGHEDDDYIRRLKDISGLPIIRAYQIREAADLERAAASAADHIMLDSGPGGTGQTFDWQLLKEMDRPYFLAGGLKPENVREAIDLLRPYAVDVSSGVETDRLKDPEKMQRFVENVRGAAL